MSGNVDDKAMGVVSDEEGELVYYSHQDRLAAARRIALENLIKTSKKSAASFALSSRSAFSRCG